MTAHRIVLKHGETMFNDIVVRQLGSQNITLYLYMFFLFFFICKYLSFLYIYLFTTFILDILKSIYCIPKIINKFNAAHILKSDCFEKAVATTRNFFLLSSLQYLSRVSTWMAPYFWGKLYRGRMRQLSAQVLHPLEEKNKFPFS